MKKPFNKMLRLIEIDKLINAYCIHCLYKEESGCKYHTRGEKYAILKDGSFSKRCHFTPNRVTQFLTDKIDKQFKDVIK